MNEFEILIKHRYRQEFDEIIKESKIAITKEDKQQNENVGSWVTVQVSSVEDAYWLGRNYEKSISKLK